MWPREQSSCGLGPNPRPGQSDLSVQSLVEDVRQPAHDLLGLTTSSREVALGSPPQCRQSRYGLLGVRIGEASNPGPLSSDDVGGSLPEEEFLDQFQQDLMSGRRRRVRKRVVDTDSDTSIKKCEDRWRKSSSVEESGVGPRK